MSRVVARVVATLALALGASLAQPAYAAESEFTWLGCEGQPTVTTGSTSSFDKGVWDDEDKAWHGTVYGQLFPCRPRSSRTSTPSPRTTPTESPPRWRPGTGCWRCTRMTPRSG